MTPEQRNNREDKIISVKRTAIYESAKNKHLERWSSKTRNWELPEEVHLNQEKQYRNSACFISDHYN
jgi:hypothetical protein